MVNKAALEKFLTIIEYDKILLPSGIGFLKRETQVKKISHLTTVIARLESKENGLKPLHVAGNMAQVKSFTQNVIVVALDKFTIPDKKFMGIQIMEKNGGRHLMMKLNNKDILKAIPLPDLK